MLRLTFKHHTCYLNTLIHQFCLVSDCLFVWYSHHLSHVIHQIIINQTLLYLHRLNLAWTEGMESKGLQINIGKAKCMFSDATMVSKRQTGKYPCSICHKGVGSNSLYCNSCRYWVHKKCSNLKGRLRDN